MFDRIVRAVALTGGIILFGLMLLTVYSVIMRYVFNAPPFFTLDTSEMMLIPVVFFSLAYCGWTGGHIAVDLIGLTGWPRLVRWTDICVRLVCAALIGLLTWKLVGLAFDAIEFDDVTNLIEIPHYPFVGVMIFGSGLYTVVLIALMIRAIRGQQDPPRS